jgi:hypothetical protein
MWSPLLRRFQVVCWSPRLSDIAVTVSVISFTALLLMVLQQFYGLPLETRVTIGPADKIGLINRETGCYRWRLPEKLNRGLNHTRAVLLENGRPLSRVMHVAAAENQSGAHFMVRGAVVRFAAGDGSDPRTNGRHYEVILPRPVRAHWMLACGLLLALALPLGLPVLRVWLKAGFGLVHRLPVWLVAALVMLAVTEDLLVNEDRSKGAFLVKGLPESDAQGWFKFATGLHDGRTVTDGFANQRPLYAVLLAAFMLPLGGSLVAAKVLNVLLLGVTAGSVFALARLLRCPWAGLAAVLFLGFSQDHLHQWHTVQTENPGLAFAAVAALALVHGMLRQSARSCLLAGLLSGLGNVAAGHVLMALPLVAVVLTLPLLRARSQWRRQGLMLVAFVCGASAMLLPWMALQKYRHGVLTITMNSSELLAGTADPKHGKLTAEILGEAEALGFGLEDMSARFAYFIGRFQRDVSADPARFARHVLTQCWLSLEYLEMEDALLQTLLVLAVLLAGAAAAWRWGAPQPLLAAAALVFLLADKELVFPGWMLLVLGFGLVLTAKTREARLVLLVLVLMLAGAMVVDGLAGNVATRRFWLATDWMLVLPALGGIAGWMELICQGLSRVPVLGLGMRLSDSPAAAETPAHDLAFLRWAGWGMVGLSLLASVVVLIRLSLGPRVFFDPAQIASQPMPALPKGQSVFLLRFDDHVMHLTRDEDVEHWLPHYQPTSEARWLAMPRLILPDGTLGQRIVLERPAKSSSEVPRWQAVQCVVETRQNIDRITGQTHSIYRALRWEPLR